MFSEYYGEVSDYTKKRGVIHSDILLPPQAPAEYQDRATLWNAVEKTERGKKAQLAYSFDIALQNEFSMEENIALARQFVSEQLVGRGMIADFAIHQPDKEDDGIPTRIFMCSAPSGQLSQTANGDVCPAKQYRDFQLSDQYYRVQSAGTDNFRARTRPAAGPRQETPEHPPIPRVRQNNARPDGRPSSGGPPKSGTSRRTSTVHTASTLVSGTSSTTQSSTQTNSRQQGQASRPIRQNGTPIISPLPGVGNSGKGERGHLNGAGTHKTSVPTQPPIGGKQATSGTAGMRGASNPAQLSASGGASSSGTAGTRKTSSPAQPPVSGGVPPSDTAGTRRTSTPAQPPVSGGTSSSGTAETRKTSSPAQPPVSGGASSSGTAGTRRAFPAKAGAHRGGPQLH